MRRLGRRARPSRRYRRAMAEPTTQRDRRTVTVTESIHVDRPPEAVFDYTQDYATRTDWDPAVRRANVLSEDPRSVEIISPGLGSYVLEYRLFRRGDRTSAAFEGVGAWLFWAAAVAVALRARRRRHPLDPGEHARAAAPAATGWLAGLIERNVRRSVRTAMARAKSIMESRPARKGGRLARSARRPPASSRGAGRRRRELVDVAVGCDGR